MLDTDPVIAWLLDPEQSDPSIRWQVMRDLLDRPGSDWSAERARVETQGWGARLLALEDADGQWAGGAYFPSDFDFDGPEAQHEPGEPSQPWTATTYTLSQLREFGLDPASDRVRRSIELIGLNARWEYDGQPYWEGEVEPCINGMTVANGAYFGFDMAALVDRLLGERMEDGGWNCEAENGSVRSSFDTTINVLEGLLEFERATGGSADSRAARRSGEAYLLERALYRRLSTGEPIERFLHLIAPSRWFYHVLRALDHFRSAALLTGAAPDPRLAEAVDQLRSRRLDDGTWPLDWNPKGRVWFDVDDGAGEPSRWVTLRALRVLRWWEEANRAA
jgi:hypothetical protein